MRDFEDIAAEVAAVVTEKNRVYGDSFGKSGKVLAILYPQGIPPGKLEDALTVVRVLDKLFRIATDRDALGESPWKDILGYALLALRRQEALREKKVDWRQGPNGEDYANFIPWAHISATSAGDIPLCGSRVAPGEVLFPANAVGFSNANCATCRGEFNRKFNPKP